MRHLSIGAGTVLFRADLPEVLAELAACYELAWVTAWEDNANLLLAPALGLPELPVVRFVHPGRDVSSRYARTWKLPSIERFAADQPLAWIDDDLHGDAYAWAAMRRIPTKLLSTNPSIGIIDRDVRALLAFARRPSGSNGTGTYAKAKPRCRARAAGVVVLPRVREGTVKGSAERGSGSNGEGSLRDGSPACGDKHDSCERRVETRFRASGGVVRWGARLSADDGGCRAHSRSPRPRWE